MRELPRCLEVSTLRQRLKGGLRVYYRSFHQRLMSYCGTQMGITCLRSVRLDAFLEILEVSSFHCQPRWLKLAASS